MTNINVNLPLIRNPQISNTGPHYYNFDQRYEHIGGIRYNKWLLIFEGIVLNLLRLFLIQETNDGTLNKCYHATNLSLTNS